MRPPDAVPAQVPTRPDRWVVLAGLAALTLIAHGRDRMADGRDAAKWLGFVRTHIGPWGAIQLTTVALMSAVMMVAMMTPSTWPMVSVFVGLERRPERRTPWLTATAFLAGYLVVWIGVSALAALAQWGLRLAALMQPGMRLASPWLGGTLLIAAGLFQFSAAKSACLYHCRSPLGFLLAEWRGGVRGALLMGLRHGAYCTGCCWLLMALLFVAGVMNAAWCAALAALVLAEKALPGDLWVARAAGLVLTALGGWLIRGAV